MEAWAGVAPGVPVRQLADHGFVPEVCIPLCGITTSGSRTSKQNGNLRLGGDSNPRIAVLQTAALPLRHRAKYIVRNNLTQS